MPMHVRIENIENNRIFQQENGYADITVTGYIIDRQERGKPGSVYACLFRESNGTSVTPFVRADMDGDRYAVTLKDIPAGGLYTLRVKYSDDGDPECCINGDTRIHLGVGDLWVMAGQSNGVGYGKTPAVDPAEDRVRLYPLGRVWRDGSQPLSDGACFDCTGLGEGFNTGNSPFVAFANELVRELNYPIGLIQTTQGGTPLSAWSKGAGLYDHMMEVIRLVGGKVRGIAWHQGCTDADREKADTYLTRFTQFVQDVRNDLGWEIPFVTAQLNKTVSRFDMDWDEPWAQVKHAQRMAARTIDNVFVSPSHDLPLSDWVHNNAIGCQVLGQRMAWAALEGVYGKPYFGHAPDAEEIIRDGSNVTVRFSHVVNWLVSAGLPPEKCDFLVEDEQGTLPLTFYECREDTAYLTLDRKPVGAAVCSFAPWRMHSGHLPFDRATAMPPLSFYREAIKTKEDA